MGEVLELPASSLYSIGETIRDIDPMLAWAARHHRVGTMLDIGAHVGAVTLIAQHHFPDVVVDAFEPHPGACAMLRRNTGHIRARTYVHQLAVVGSDYRGEPILYERGESLLGCSLVMADRRGRSIRVDTCAVATLPRADLVKVDVEGCEGGIVSQYAYMPHAEPPRVYLVETHDRANAACVRSALESDYELVMTAPHPRFHYRLELWSR